MRCYISYSCLKYHEHDFIPLAPGILCYRHEYEINYIHRAIFTGHNYTALYTFKGKHQFYPKLKLFWGGRGLEI